MNRILFAIIICLLAVNAFFVLALDPGQVSQLPVVPKRIRTENPSIPIILYHHIRPITSNMSTLAAGLSITPDHFENQLSVFKKNGYATISLRELYDSVQNHMPLPPKPIVLTFDDGYKDFYTYAFPLLEKYHMIGVQFIPTGLIGGSDYMSWDEVRTLADSPLVEIESHTISHPELPRLSEKKAQTEIEMSKKILEGKIGKPVDFFCYPYGAFMPTDSLLVRNAGYRAALTTRYGLHHSLEDAFEWRRVRLSNDDIGKRLERRLLTFERL